MKKLFIIAAMLASSAAHAQQRPDPALDTAMQLLSEANQRVVTLSAALATARQENEALKSAAKKPEELPK